MNRSFAVALCAVAGLSSCASIVSKTTWPVTVTTTPEDAEVEIVSEKGTVVQKAHAPFTVPLKSGDGWFNGETYTLKCSAPGYEDTTAVLDTKLNGWYAGNFLLIGGLLGLLVVDPLSGAMYRLPPSTHVDLAKLRS